MKLVSIVTIAVTMALAAAVVFWTIPQETKTPVVSNLPVAPQPPAQTPETAASSTATSTPFKGPTGEPHIKGPTSNPPNY